MTVHRLAPRFSRTLPGVEVNVLTNTTTKIATDNAKLAKTVRSTANPIDENNSLK